VPEHCTDDHSKLLSNIAERFSDPRLQEQLRSSGDAKEIFKLLSSTTK
jgi:mannitol/fructose-specific phosphotransferase system IIA component (Ntr-type)